MNLEIERTRRRFAYIEHREVANPVTRLTRRIVTNNAKSVAARVAAIMRAIEEAERLVLELDDQSSIPEKLGELAAGLPIVEDPKIA
jgi:hypothetical protein